MRKRGRKPLDPSGAESETLSIRIPPDLHRQASEVAEKRGVNLAELTRRALRREIRLYYVTINCAVTKPDRY